MPSETSGRLEFTYAGETYHTWYRVDGDLSSGVTPLVVVHGGPGTPHGYMIQHVELLQIHNIPTIMYDQIGCGQSTRLQDKPKEFLTIELFEAELDNLLSKLGVANNFSLLGHSWGGMVGVEFVANRQPHGLKRLVLTNSLASMRLWEVSLGKLLSRYPQEFQNMLLKHEEEGTTSSEEYEEGMMRFFHQHLCRLDPWPAELFAGLVDFRKDPTVLHALLGPAEFKILGSLKAWSVIDKLDKITCPTLLINSVHDEAQDECQLPFFERIPRVKWVQFANSSHMPFLEEKERYLQVVGDFLTKEEYK